MCIDPITAGFAAGASSTAIATSALAISAIGAAASAGIGIMSAQQQAAAAQANLNAQAQAQAVQMEQAQQQALQQQQQQYQALSLQQQQATQNYHLQVESANAQILNKYNQDKRSAAFQRSGIMRRDAIDRQTYQAQVEAARAQVSLNNESANRAYTAEQIKLEEARKQAAFEQQAILARSIGAKGTLLAAGRTGQSVGLLVQDVERQQGFAEAQSQATLDSKRDAAIIAMEGNWLQAESANQRAISGVGFAPETPYLPKDPRKPQFVGGIGIASSS